MTPDADRIPRTPAEVDEFLRHARQITCRERTEAADWAWRIIYSAQQKARHNPDPMLDKEAHNG